MARNIPIDSVFVLPFISGYERDSREGNILTHGIALTIQNSHRPQSSRGGGACEMEVQLICACHNSYHRTAR